MIQTKETLNSTVVSTHSQLIEYMQATELDSMDVVILCDIGDLHILGDSIRNLEYNFLKPWNDKIRALISRNFIDMVEYNLYPSRIPPKFFTYSYPLVSKEELEKILSSLGVYESLLTTEKLAETSETLFID